MTLRDRGRIKQQPPSVKDSSTVADAGAAVMSHDTASVLEYAERQTAQQAPHRAAQRSNHRSHTAPPHQFI